MTTLSPSPGATLNRGAYSYNTFDGNDLGQPDLEARPSAEVPANLDIAKREASSSNNNEQISIRDFDGIKLTLKEESVQEKGALFLSSGKIRITVIHSPFRKMNDYSIAQLSSSVDSSREACFEEIAKKVDESYCCCCKFLCKYFCCCC